MQGHRYRGNTQLEVAITNQLPVPVTTSNQLHAPVTTSNQLHAQVTTSNQLHVPVTTSNQLHAIVTTSNQLHVPVTTSNQLHAPVTTSNQLHAPVTTFISGCFRTDQMYYLEKNRDLDLPSPVIEPYRMVAPTHIKDLNLGDRIHSPNSDQEATHTTHTH